MHFCRTSTGRKRWGVPARIKSLELPEPGLPGGAHVSAGELIAATDESAERTHIDLSEDFTLESLSKEAQYRAPVRGGCREWEGGGKGTGRAGVPESPVGPFVRRNTQPSHPGIVAEQSRDRHQGRLQRLGFIVQLFCLFFFSPQ